MKKCILSVLAVVVISLTFLACTKDNGKDDGIPILSIGNAIVNPPDTFKLYIPLKAAGGSVYASITFDTNSVWKISKITGQSSNFWAQRNDNDTLRLVIQDTLIAGFQGNTIYNFYATMGTYESKNKLFILFEKQPDSYSTFSPKF